MSASPFPVGDDSLPAGPLVVHPHRWRIDEQQGAQSRGRCACGAERDFENGWSDDSRFRLSGGGWTSHRREPVGATATRRDAPG
jgi:hypothetical protein